LKIDKVSQSNKSHKSFTKGLSTLVKMEKLTFCVNKMIMASSPLDSALAMILACKKAFLQLKQVTIFVVDMHLQYYIQKMSPSSNKHTKDISCEGVENNTIVAVYEHEYELCHPVF